MNVRLIQQKMELAKVRGKKIQKYKSLFTLETDIRDFLRIYYPTVLSPLKITPLKIKYFNLKHINTVVYDSNHHYIGGYCEDIISLEEYSINDGDNDCAINCDDCVLSHKNLEVLKQIYEIQEILHDKPKKKTK